MLKKLILVCCILLLASEHSLVAFWSFGKKTEPEIATTELTDKEAQIEKLIAAASRGNREAVEKILNTGVDINSKSRGGQTALQKAAAASHANLVAFLLEHGANATLADNQNVTPLIAAIMSFPSRLDRKAVEDMVKILIAHGADVNTQNKNGQTPLMLAIASELFTVIQLLLDAGANTNFKNSYNESPLDLIGDKVLLSLEERYKDVTAKKAATSDPESLEVFDIELKSIQRQITALQQIRELFASRKELLEAAATNNREKIQALLAHNISINSKDELGQTALHKAAMHGHKDIAAFLLQHGANLDIKDTIGQTPLHKALKSGQLEMVTFLIEQGADYTSTDKENNNALMLAIMNYPKHKNLAALTQLTRTLIEYGIDIDQKNKSGQTALTLAIPLNLLNIIHIFLEIGAKVDIKDNSGRSPIDWATATHNTLLQELFAKIDPETQARRATVYKQEIARLQIERTQQKQAQIEAAHIAAERAKEELQKKEEARRNEEQEKIQRQRALEAEQVRQANIRRQENQAPLPHALNEYNNSLNALVEAFKSKPCALQVKESAIDRHQ